jgi:hypothetical protein
MESPLQDLGDVLRLAAVTCEALLHFEAVALSGFGVLFGASCGCRHRALLCTVALL